MGSCNISQFPEWLRTQKEVESLSFSSASISGALPKWFGDMPLSDLDLSHNSVSGSFLNLPSSLIVLELSNNSFSGPLPRDIGDAMPALEELHLSDNLINGSIPASLCKMTRMFHMDLSRNRLSGNLPYCLKDLQEMWILKLASNRLSGVIPESLILSLGDNGLSGKIPNWLGANLAYLGFLNLRNNNFNGSIPSQLCQLSYLQILDLAGNDLTRNIPNCLGNISGMTMSVSAHFFEWTGDKIVQVLNGVELAYTTTLLLLVNMDLSSNKLVGEISEELSALSVLLGLNLSHNHLTGSIPDKVGDLKSLISLDFSSNHLSGTIPQSMSALTSLSHLNLSHNFFSGKIPTGPQLQTLDDPSIYAGNTELCGAPLPNKCPGQPSRAAPMPTSHEERDEDDESDKLMFYLVVMSGYATGLWGVLGVLLFKKQWRPVSGCDQRQNTSGNRRESSQAEDEESSRRVNAM
ncbi:hypothetical protein RJ639_004838 [Escallonia herrerae]|uniref:Uncharacterized protein n=1 Tax=Escallonia herrerae TaxID=1293975 RepID=A0AA88W0H0_9ASTE|nr:hypothetical protein RJ639_004838 [Escallonia herrerae]